MARLHYMDYFFNAARSPTVGFSWPVDRFNLVVFYRYLARSQTVGFFWQMVRLALLGYFSITARFHIMVYSKMPASNSGHPNSSGVNIVS